MSSWADIQLCQSFVCGFYIRLAFSTIVYSIVQPKSNPFYSKELSIFFMSLPMSCSLLTRPLFVLLFCQNKQGPRDKASCNVVIGMSHLHFGQQQTTPQCYFLLSKNQIREFFNYVLYIVYVGFSGAESLINLSNYLC